LSCWSFVLLVFFLVGLLSYLEPPPPYTATKRAKPLPFFFRGWVLFKYCLVLPSLLLSCLVIYCLSFHVLSCWSFFLLVFCVVECCVTCSLQELWLGGGLRVLQTRCPGS
jgi:hypothetical protein